MQEVFEEYGEFVIEVIGGILLLLILGYFFLDTPLHSFFQMFIESALGGGV